MARLLTPPEISDLSKYYRGALKNIVNKEEDFQRLVNLEIEAYNWKLNWIAVLTADFDSREVQTFHDEVIAQSQDYFNFYKEMGLTDYQVGKIIIATNDTCHNGPLQKIDRKFRNAVFFAELCDKNLARQFLEDVKVTQKEIKRLIIIGSDFKPNNTLIGKELNISPEEVGSVFKRVLKSKQLDIPLDQSGDLSNKQFFLYQKALKTHSFGFFCNLKAFSALVKRTENNELKRVPL